MAICVLLTRKQQYRRYATEPPKAGGSNAAIYSAALAVLAGGGYYFYSQGDNPQKVAAAADKAKAGGAQPKSAFLGGDQGFISLKLESVENINHNTKKLRFALPEKDQVSGLHVASAFLTKYKGPESEKPVIRPYTPVSDEGKCCLGLSVYRMLIIYKAMWALLTSS